MQWAILIIFRAFESVTRPVARKKYKTHIHIPTHTPPTHPHTHPHKKLANTPTHKGNKTENKKKKFSAPPPFVCHWGPSTSFFFGGGLRTIIRGGLATAAALPWWSIQVMPVSQVKRLGFHFCIFFPVDFVYLMRPFKIFWFILC